jgi:hypothetical protein
VPITVEANTRRIIVPTIGPRSPAQAAIQSHIVERASFDAVAAEDRLLAVERHVVGQLAGDDMGQEPRARQTLLDRLGEPRGDHHMRGAAGTRVFRPDVFQDDQAGGDVFELLADFLADRPTLGAALRAGAVLGGDVMDDPLARQARRQGLAAVTAGLRPGRRRRLRRRRHRLGLGQDVPSEEQELIGIDPLGLLAVAVSQELFELVLELGDDTLAGETVLARSDEISQPAVRAKRGRFLVDFRSMPPRTAASSEAVHST